MSNSTKAKGKKMSKKDNVLAKRDLPVKMKPYGIKRGNTYTSNEDLVPEVTKKYARQVNKKEINNGLKDIEEDCLMGEDYSYNEHGELYNTLKKQ